VLPSFIEQVSRHQGSLKEAERNETSTMKVVTTRQGETRQKLERADGLDYLFKLLIYAAVSLLQSRAQGSRIDEKKKFHEWRVPKNTPVNDPKAIEQTVPPRCAMQGPICGGPPC
jgi:hypothetical protein